MKEPRLVGRQIRAGGIYVGGGRGGGVGGEEMSKKS